MLLPVSNPETARSLFNFAILIHRPHQESTIHPLTVAINQSRLEQSILNDKTVTDYFTDQAMAAKVQYQPALRIDSNISEGIVRAAIELQINCIVLGWSGQSGTARYFFGTIVSNLLNNCQQMILVTNLISRILRFKKIYVVVPRNADHEVGFYGWLTMMLLLQRNTAGELLFIGDAHTLANISGMKEAGALAEKHFRILYDFPDMQALSGELNVEDLFVVISARPNTVSYSRKLAVMPRVVTRYFGHTNSVILYPEQADMSPDNLGSTFGGI